MALNQLVTMCCKTQQRRLQNSRNGWHQSTSGAKASGQMWIHKLIQPCRASRGLLTGLSDALMTFPEYTPYCTVVKVSTVLQQPRFTQNDISLDSDN